ncbi:MAG: hypothetical protein GX575_12175 [Candidatus Anammoximicrobium sp.]|nr:hypothetical protein [Candidatus Anammoximicrobium sp.]
MFGQATVADAKLEAWLDLLRQAEPTTRRGALIERNLRDDANVCPALQQDLRDFVAAQSPAATPDDAAEQYERFLQDLHQDGPPCQHPDNIVNQIPTAPPPRLARSVDGDAFLKYNYLPANNRKVPRYHRASPSVKTKIRLRELQRRGVQTAALRGSIGRSVVFATSDSVATRYQAGTLAADGVRDRLGLDDPVPYGRDQFMVIYVYEVARVADGAFYRPTVLDAGWKGSAIAFLPSPPGPARPGQTQDLATGLPAEPEVLHAVFPAAQVQEIVVAGPLTQDPSNHYKTVRLAAVAAASP